MKLTTKIIVPTAILLVLAVSIVSWIGYRNIAKEIDMVMRVTTQTALADLISQVDGARNDAERLEQSLNGNFLRIARSIAFAIDRNPDLLEEGTMAAMARDVGVDEIHVVNDAGVLFAGSVPEFFGFDFHTNDQTLPFLRMLDHPDFELAQEPQTRAVDDKLFQYIGVPVRSIGGLVQIGVRPTELQDLLESTSLQNLLEDNVYANGGYAYVISTDTNLVTHHSIPDRVGLNMTDFDFGEKIVEMGEGEFIYTYNDVEVFVSFTTIDAGIVATSVPTANYLGRLRPIVFALAGASALSLAVLLTGLFGVVRRLVAPLRRISDSLGDIATGDADLTKRLDSGSRDEIGAVARNFNDFMANLQGLIGQIQRVVVETRSIDQQLSNHTGATEEATEDINRSIASAEDRLKILQAKISENATAMEQITSNVNSFDNMISSQAALVEESTAAITEMIASLENVNKITTAKKESTESLKKIAEAGKEQIDRTSDDFAVVVDRIDRIQEMANTINNIASQTNLLSMNAAIEAAHAGDAGRGFAVVAEEIRKLAETAGSSSGSITNLISEITGDVQNASVSVAGTRETFDSIVREVDSTVDAFREIENAVSELSMGGRQIMESTEEINRVTIEVNRSSSEIHRGVETSNNALITIRDNAADVSSGISIVISKSTDVLEAIRVVKGLGVDLSGITGDLSMQFDQFVTE